jgi:hypothetical protein
MDAVRTSDHLVQNNVIEKTWSSSENIGPGIWVYRDVFPQEMNVVNRLENVLNMGNPRYKWNEALVGYHEKMPEYRDCYDHKFKKTDIELDQSNESLLLQSIWDECYERQKNAVRDYSEKYNMGNNLRYWEAFNFIKYGPGQHFMEHHDHGFSYNCTLSLVAYPNDDYEGGELYFRLQNLKVKADAGDLFIFPSNFMYPHRVNPVTSGTRYSFVSWSW